MAIVFVNGKNPKELITEPGHDIRRGNLPLDNKVGYASVNGMRLDNKALPEERIEPDFEFTEHRTAVIRWGSKNIEV